MDSIIDDDTPYRDEVAKLPIATLISDIRKLAANATMDADEKEVRGIVLFGELSLRVAQKEISEQDYQKLCEETTWI